MSPIRRAVAAWLRRTDPGPASLTRVRTRLERAQAPMDVGREPKSLSRRLLQAIPEPSPVPLARVRRRLHVNARPSNTSEFLRGIRIGGGVGGVAIAITAVLLVLDRPVPLDGVLEGDASRDVTTLLGVVHSGRGLVGGTDARPRLTWEWGTLAVEVAPNRGADVEVSTPEAHVRVVGTAFTVTRDRLGTAVGVARGTVEMTCLGQAPMRLAAGDAHLCLPTRAAGLLGRAQALLDAGAAEADVLDAVDRGLVMSSGAVGRELSLLRLELLVGAGRDAEALNQASALLAEPAGDEVRTIRRLAATAARQEGGCAGLRDWLDPLPDHEREAPDLVALADCTPETVRARQLLDAAAVRATDPRQADAIRARLLNLPQGAPK